ncbi:ABC transporter ATP-binding protein [Frigoribacterium sp. CFBP 8766]|uniref:ABC transporter ATP-binding protein n=1 Tax=Frigoribacterium sp. CFBP 8766 TaxID=2775273 RepID=UPI00177FD85C|nr:ABC transporter ATP-binding protein [Frigoribacterium sp. CFBP 8766]MBD8584941.1 ABC transporter ATP-binding protein [Frigoribacterium sp. CFBP 8766]
MSTDNILAVDDVDFADAPTVVSVKNVSKRFVIRRDNSLKERIVTLGRAGRRHSEDFWALKDVTLDIPAGTTIGLLGPNGSGKSTLLKVIGGILEPTTGEVSRRGRLAALIELGAGFHPDLTGRENVYLNAAILGITQEEAEAKFDDILLFSGIGDFIDTQVKFYSSGMYVRLAFAVAIHTDPDVLLVDEVLAVGDEQFQKKCLDKIREFQQQGRTIVLVSHSLGQVQELCDSAVVLHHGEVKFQGSARHAVKNFREILEGRRVAEAEAANPDEDATPGSVDKVEIASPGRAPGEELRPGDDLVIRMTVSHTTPLEEWNSGFKIENQHGHLVYGTDSRKIGLVHSPLHGTTTVEYRLDDLQFGGGPYFIHCFLAKKTGEHIAILREAARFVMADDDRHGGMTRVATAGRELRA